MPYRKRSAYTNFEVSTDHDVLDAGSDLLIAALKPDHEVSETLIRLVLLLDVSDL